MKYSYAMSPKLGKYKRSVSFFIVDSLKTLLILFTVFLIMNIFLGQLLIVTGNSMYPTLRDGEQILGEKLSLNFTEPKRGEVVIFRVPSSGKLVIKRVIALPGENVAVKGGKVYVDGKELSESYVGGKPTEQGKFLVEGEVRKVPEREYFLLGDNRNQSTDSREWGFIPKENIESRARLVYFPLKNLRII